MKINFVAVFAVVLGVLFSNLGMAERSQRKSGFYLGPSLGASQLLGEQTMAYFGNGTGLFGLKSRGHNATLYWGGVAGYHMPVMEKSFIDFDVYYVNQNNQADFTIDNNGFMYASTYLKKKHSYGAAVSLGAVLYEGEGQMPLSGYVRLGIENGVVENKRVYDGQEYRGQTFKGSKTFTSFAPGIGLKLGVGENSFLKLGYTYVFPHSYSAYLPYTVNLGGYYNHKFNYREQRFELSFAYQF